ncbi:MAG: LysM peptidoglycan-binding domain-containing protein [Candidatus Pedobacter colombiensis]|uniref:LysM peptidoglycan-binding domain-containing protein n=1 Tax=Candidatus Pedobacter colombiensis TaxID=3121371 RepID=A0AAJ5WBP0_9SPHI|nr:LysM peptidoglycan-binding domain-containing protein [Pedobacter sp.]WEK21666.1 MAG: LysM peptidoglycan-binding domain-containing protein [Pedobacter sp.]
MQYIIKKGDTMSKIAHRFSLPVKSLFVLNPQIIDPNKIFIGQVIQVPNLSDVPNDADFETPSNPTELVLRARSVVNSSIGYKLGSGGMFPKDALPSRDNFCDCSGFVCWVLHLSRKTDIPFYKHFGGWIFTDSMEADVQRNAGIFEKLQFPEPGCIVVYGAGAKIGHVGLVSDVSGNVMKKVIHCSLGNSNKFNAAIQETAPTVFNRADAVWGRFVG